ncbi:hypothetical protein V1517DRAFT_311073 [Lipomyces orientalis]|uniref:Uncharacterized protein n=1 Tax=Lipomyces orientalis TaxID=1233043 RepID=A0ACC3TDU7_9ASCO
MRTARKDNMILLIYLIFFLLLPIGLAERCHISEIATVESTAWSTSGITFYNATHSIVDGELVAHTWVVKLKHKSDKIRLGYIARVRLARRIIHYIHEFARGTRGTSRDPDIYNMQETDDGCTHNYNVETRPVEGHNWCPVAGADLDAMMAARIHLTQLMGEGGRVEVGFGTEGLGQFNELILIDGLDYPGC